MILNWLRKLSLPIGTEAKGQRRRSLQIWRSYFKPAVEVLEDRTLLSTIAADAFNYPIGTALNGQNGGDGFSSAWSGTAIFGAGSTIANGSLVFPGLATSGQRMVIAGP